MRLIGNLVTKTKYSMITCQPPQNYAQPNQNEYVGDNQNAKNNAYTTRMNGNYANVQTNRGLHETVWWYDMCRLVGKNLDPEPLDLAELHSFRLVYFKHKEIFSLFFV